MSIYEGPVRIHHNSGVVLESRWLHEILASGDIVDNQIYVAQGHIITNNRLEELKLFKAYSGMRKADKQLPWKAYEFLARDVVKINQKIREGKNKVFLFGDGEYEHNTDDPLIRFSGLNAGNFTLTTGNLIGEVSVGDQVLRINSRFGKHFLRYIISDAEGFLEIKEVGSLKKETVYEWLIFHLWITKLRKAFRLGIPKRYVKKREELHYVRGNVDLVKYFQNPVCATLECRYTSMSHENEASRLIATVFKRNENNLIIGQEASMRAAFYQASNGKFLKPASVDKVKSFSNPYYSAYNDVLSLSKIILKKGSLGFGNDEKNNAFLFDVSMLFEYFVKKLFIRSGLNVLDKFTNTSIIPKGFRKNHGLQPDIVVNQNESYSVFDVKYKNFDFSKGCNREDLFQLHTYVGQYSNLGKVNCAGLIYPIKQNKLKEQGHYYKESFSIGGKTLDFYIIFIEIPETDNFIDFSQSFQSLNEQFQKTIIKITNEQ